MGLKRWVMGVVARFRVRNELYDDQPERHPALRACQVNELIPFKGTMWRVASIRELPIPAIVLVPVRETRASKVQAIRTLRRADRILTRDEATVRRSLEKRAQRSI